MAYPCIYICTTAVDVPTLNLKLPLPYDAFGHASHAASHASICPFIRFYVNNKLLPVSVCPRQVYLCGIELFPVLPCYKSTLCVFFHPHIQGGESVALARLKYYLWDSDLVADYFNTRNGMLGCGLRAKRRLCVYVCMVGECVTRRINTNKDIVRM